MFRYSFGVLEFLIQKYFLTTKDSKIDFRLENIIFLIKKPNFRQKIFDGISIFMGYLMSKNILEGPVVIFKPYLVE